MKRNYIIIGVIALVVIVVTLLVILLPKDKKGKDNKEENVSQLVCKSGNGSITMTYNDTRITSYAQDQIEFNLKEQNDQVKEIGLDKYLEEFTLWFTINYQGECTKYE